MDKRLINEATISLWCLISQAREIRNRAGADIETVRRTVDAENIAFHIIGMLTMLNRGEYNLNGWKRPSERWPNLLKLLQHYVVKGMHRKPRA